MIDVRQRRRERLEQERPLLTRAFPSAILDVEAGIVILVGHKLPSGWSHDESDVLVEVPERYPSTPPDNVCARPDLSLAGGSAPQSNQGHREIAGRGWLQFSYHVEAADWRPDVDLARSSTLVDYLHGALSRFEEAS